MSAAVGASEPSVRATYDAVARAYADQLSDELATSRWTVHC